MLTAIALAQIAVWRERVLNSMNWQRIEAILRMKGL